MGLNSFYPMRPRELLVNHLLSTAGQGSSYSYLPKQKGAKVNDTNVVLARVREVVEASFDVDPQSVSIETTASDIPGWDSMGHLALASKLEQAFHINLDVDDMMEMENVREIVRIVQTKLAMGV
jgi:acyl carrier protein